MFGAPEQTDLEPILDVLEEWAEQLKHVDIAELFETGDKSAPELADAELDPPDSALTTTPAADPGPEPGGPV